MIDQQSRMFRYVSGFSSLRSLFPMSTPSELLSGYGRGEVSYNDMITRIGAILRRQGLGTTLRVHKLRHVTCAVPVVNIHINVLQLVHR